MVRRVLAVLACLMLLAGCMTAAQAEIAWPVLTTQGQLALQSYVLQVNTNLMTLGGFPINSIFESYANTMTLGVTAQDNTEMPEGIELNFVLTSQDIAMLSLRVSNIASFATLATSCIQAADQTRTLEDARIEPDAWMQKALAEPGNSFEQEVDETRGETLRAYYAYYPNQYRDNVNWIVLELVFPMTEITPPTAIPETETPAITPEPTLAP